MCEEQWSGERELNRGTPQFSEFFMNFSEKQGWSLLGGLLAAPHLQEPFAEVATGSIGADHSKPSSSTALDSTRSSSESNHGLVLLGSLDSGMVQSFTGLDHSSASEVASDMVPSKFS